MTLERGPSFPEEQFEPTGQEFSEIVDELVVFLQKNGVNIDSWGDSYQNKSGKVIVSKTLLDLAHEILAGDVVLIASKGTVLRYTEAVKLEVFYQNDQTGKTFELVEGLIISDDPTQRVRKRWGVSEKLKVGEKESEIEGALRAIREELGFEPSSEQLILQDKVRTQGTISRSYPGIYNSVLLFFGEFWLTDAQYREEGYVEESPTGRMTVFVWSEINSNT